MNRASGRYLQVTQLLARANRARRFQAGAREAAAGREAARARQLQQQTREVARQAEASLIGEGKAVSAAVVQLVGSARDAQRRHEALAEQAVRATETRARKATAQRVEAARRDLGATRRAAVAAAAYRDAALARVDAEIQRDAELHRASLEA